MQVFGCEVMMQLHAKLLPLAASSGLDRLLMHHFAIPVTSSYDCQRSVPLRVQRHAHLHRITGRVTSIYVAGSLTSTRYAG